MAAFEDEAIAGFLEGEFHPAPSARPSRPVTHLSLQAARLCRRLR